jgi:hypothetical protein
MKPNFSGELDHLESVMLCRYNHFLTVGEHENIFPKRKQKYRTSSPTDKCHQVVPLKS